MRCLARVCILLFRILANVSFAVQTVVNEDIGKQILTYGKR